MHLRNALLIWLVSVSPTFGQAIISRDRDGDITVDDIVMKQGYIVTITRVKGGKIQLEFQEDNDNTIFTCDWQTAAYKLTERNRQIFKELDKRADIVKDINSLRRRLKDLPEKELNYIMSHYQRLYVSNSGTVEYYVFNSPSAAQNLTKAQMEYRREEKERLNNYGPRIRLRPNMTAYLVAAKRTDTTYAIFVTGAKEGTKEKELLSAADEMEAEAARKLKFAKDMMADADKASGKEQERLL